MTVSCVQTEPLQTAMISAGMKDAPLENAACMYSTDTLPILMIKSDDTLVFVNSKEDGEIEGLYEELSQ